MDPVSNQDLFLQIRSAHRMLAAYYQRLIPTLSQITADLDLHFYYWDPSEFSRPCRSTSDIVSANYWQWDLLPGIATRYFYQSFQDDVTDKFGHCLVELFVISDSGVLAENRRGVKGVQPDALQLAQPVEGAESLLRIVIFTPCRSSEGRSFHQLWNRANYPPLTDQPAVYLDEAEGVLMASGFEVTLAELMTPEGVDALIRRIAEYRSVLLAAAEEAYQQKPPE